MGRKTQEPRRLRVYEQWQGNEVRINSAVWSTLSYAWAAQPACNSDQCWNCQLYLPVATSPVTVVKAASPRMPACLTARLPDTCLCLFLVTEVFLLGPLHHWPKLEVRYGFPGTTHRTNSGVPGVCGALHVSKHQPNILGCQVRHAYRAPTSSCRLAVQQDDWSVMQM
jgi:hypothetical protein